MITVKDLVIGIDTESQVMIYKAFVNVFVEFIVLDNGSPALRMQALKDSLSEISPCIVLQTLSVHYSSKFLRNDARQLKVSIQPGLERAY